MVREAANMKKYNLSAQSRYNCSVSSLHAYSPDSPAGTSPSPTQSHTISAFPLLSNNPAESPSSENPVTSTKEVKVEKPDVNVLQQLEVQAQAQEEPPEVFAFVKVAEEDTWEETPGDNIAENSTVNITVIETSQDLSSLENTEHISEISDLPFERMEKAIETNQIPVESCSTEGDAGFDRQEAQSEALPDAIESYTSKDTNLFLKTAPEVLSVASTEEKRRNDTVVSVALEPTIRLCAEELSANSSWVTEEEVHFTEDDELVVEVSPEAESIKPIMVKCEAISDAEEARPPDCLKEIRSLVTQVIEVKENIQFHEDSAETNKEFKQTQ